MAHATKKGRLRCAFRQADGRVTEKTLYPVKYMEGLSENLFSVTTELSNGGVLSSDADKNLVLKYRDGRDIVFDRR